MNVKLSHDEYVRSTFENVPELVFTKKYYFTKLTKYISINWSPWTTSFRQKPIVTTGPRGAK